LVTKEEGRSRVAFECWTQPYQRHVDPARFGKAVMMGLIIGLLVLWLVLVVVGFAVKALLWLAIIGIVLFLLTSVFGAIRGRGRRRAL
jgi:uncharacterized protein YacL